jgi:hypothetical protein
VGNETVPLRYYLTGMLCRRLSFGVVHDSYITTLRDHHFTEFGERIAIFQGVWCLVYAAFKGTIGKDTTLQQHLTGPHEYQLNQILTPLVSSHNVDTFLHFQLLAYSTSNWVIHARQKYGCWHEPIDFPHRHHAGRKLYRAIHRLVLKTPKQTK